MRHQHHPHHHPRQLLQRQRPHLSVPPSPSPHQPTNPSHAGGPIPATIWSVIEANSGIICACLPKLRQPLSAIFPCLHRTTDISSLPGYGGSDRSGYKLGSRAGRQDSESGYPTWTPPREASTMAAVTAKGSANGAPLTRRDTEESILRSGENIRVTTTTDVDVSKEYAGSASSRGALPHAS